MAMSVLWWMLIVISNVDSKDQNISSYMMISIQFHCHWRFSKKAFINRWRSVIFPKCFPFFKFHRTWRKQVNITCEDLTKAQPFIRFAQNCSEKCQ